ncbi:MAG: hypothetical protein H6835_18145 [Planctomycetes bacterium]|nr:hypothetical protein [Planctomycetota bacterium]
MSQTSSTTLLEQAGSSPAGGGASVVGAPAAGLVTRLSLLRALGTALLVLAVVGAGIGALLYGIGTLPMASLSYYLVGLCAAAMAIVVTVALHGRFAATPAPLGGARSGGAGDNFLVAGRLQSLLAAAFAVKVIVLVLGIVVLRQVPLPVFGAAATAVSDAGDTSPKFSDVATFAVTFAGAALLCQLTTAFALSRSLRRPAASARHGATPTS